LYSKQKGMEREIC